MGSMCVLVSRPKSSPGLNEIIDNETNVFDLVFDIVVLLLERQESNLYVSYVYDDFYMMK